MSELVIPKHALALWHDLEKGMVVVNQQEVDKATDIKFLFDKGLIRLVKASAELKLPARGIVLSEQGKRFMASSI